jgi:hypothetical protein
MQLMKNLTRIGMVLAFGLLLLASGCGGGADSAASTDPTIGQKKREAREAAYGKAGIPKGTGTSTNSQAAARQKAQGGHP